MLACWQTWKCLKKTDALCCGALLVVWLPSTLPWTCSWGFHIFVCFQNYPFFYCYVNSTYPSGFWFPLSAASSWCPVILGILTNNVFPIFDTCIMKIGNSAPVCLYLSLSSCNNIKSIRFSWNVTWGSFTEISHHVPIFCWNMTVMKGSLYEDVCACLHTFWLSLSIYWRAKCCKWTFLTKKMECAIYVLCQISFFCKLYSFLD